jgi:hypothetical protein
MPPYLAIITQAVPSDTSILTNRTVFAGTLCVDLNLRPSGAPDAIHKPGRGICVVLRTRAMPNESRRALFATAATRIVLMMPVTAEGAPSQTLHPRYAAGFAVGAAGTLWMWLIFAKRAQGTHVCFATVSKSTWGTVITSCGTQRIHCAANFTGCAHAVRAANSGCGVPTLLTVNTRCTKWSTIVGTICTACGSSLTTGRAHIPSCALLALRGDTSTAADALVPPSRTNFTR